MEIEKAVYAVTRLINVAGTHMNAFNRKKYVKEKVALLDDDQKQSLVKVLKAVTLLVYGGEMEILRDPSKFDDLMAKGGATFNHPWVQIASMVVLQAIYAADPSFDENDSPTPEDYIMAKKVLTAIGSSTTSSGAVTDMDPDVRAKSPEHLSGYDTLYRGLKGVSDRIIRRVAIKKPWSIKHGVSTSYEKRTAMDFAGLQSDGTASGGGPSVFFTINNPKKKGFIADTLSDYGEYEVILSGDFQIDKWILSGHGRMSAKVDDKYTGIRTLMQANSETMEIKFIYQQHFRAVDVLTFDDNQLFLDAIDKYAFNQGKFESDKLGMPNNISKWVPSRGSVLIAADVTLI
tara:strand:- start:539 stop:1576 length:1038 start_codon:yes stop_codon:yes gene_type:complete